MAKYIAIGVIVAIIVIIIIAMIVTYNNLILLKNKVKNSFAQMDTQLQRRFDLIPNLVETVRGFADHEKELLENVAESRSGYLSATTNREKVAMSNLLTTNLRSLFGVTENYPDLKANMNFLELQRELSVIEEKITFSRQFYNDTVTMYNNKLLTFPNNILGSLLGFKEEELFSADSMANVAPQVRF